MDDAITPAQIKQRLMTTATVMNFPNRLPWARRLDVKRAVSHLKQAVIVDTLQQEQLATVVNKRAVLSFRAAVAGNQALSVPVGSLRRLTRIAGAQPRFDLAVRVPAQEAAPRRCADAADRRQAGGRVERVRLAPQRRWPGQRRPDVRGFRRRQIRLMSAAIC